MTTLSRFTNLYPLSKTLKFELIPIGKTLAHIKKNGLLEQDEERLEDYKKLKQLIDSYHKAFINEALKGLELSKLKDYYHFYKIKLKDESQKKQYDNLEAQLRKQIEERFTKHPDVNISKRFKNLFLKELIKEDLRSFTKDTEELAILKRFENFTTYFNGFHENRKNMYSGEEKSTAIAYRLIHQNLPKHIDNMATFEKVLVSSISNDFNQILKDLEPVIQVNEISEVFALDYFNETLTQLGIDRYNTLIGGYTSDDGKIKIKGLNEYINLYNQIHPKDLRIGKFKPLYKQILSDRNTASFLPEQFEDDQTLLNSIEALYQELTTTIFKEQDEVEMTLPFLLKNIEEFDLDRIYIRNDLGLTDISQKCLGSWSVIQEGLCADFDSKYNGKHTKGSGKYEEEQTKYIKRFESLSVNEINQAIQLLGNKSYTQNIVTYFTDLGKKHGTQEPDLFEKLRASYLAAEPILKSYPSSKNIIQDQNAIQLIKTLLDNIKAIQHFIKPLLGKGNEPEKDARFYGELERIWNNLDQITPLYNKVRNYLTKKPYSTQKFKLNFENSTLLDGWDVNKVENNSGVLFKKDNQYYLGILDKKNNKIFRNTKTVDNNNAYQKINYKLLPGASKMLPKVFFSESNIKYFEPSDEILNIRNHGTHTKNGKPQTGYEKLDFNIQDCRKMIDFYKVSIEKHKEWKNFNFNFKATEAYESIDEFYREVEQQGYSISYSNISEAYINQMIEEGKLYLFKIHNKDFSPHSKGTPNMHTLYWKMLFDEDNLKDVVYKLNGEAEIFYRKASIKEEDKIVHRANEELTNKNPLNKKQKSLFKYDITKNKRFTEDKFQFHVPITLNFKAIGSDNINPITNEWIKENQIKHIIGIDRGERHLLYITVIDLKGNIKEQFSLNSIKSDAENQPFEVNYHDLLNRKEGDRDEARKNWQTIENIKELKTGYLSQVIHKITTLILKYDAIVVLEDLNQGFMRGRQKVEKQVYQKFEKMLIDKLNYLVKKNANTKENGGLLSALQLTSKFTSFQKLGKQSGILFYVQAWNTSKMDPVTGFVNLFTIKYESIEKSKQFFKKFDSIKYNASKKWFEFDFDYNHFTTKADGTKTQWKLATHGNRIKTFRNPAKNNEWDNHEFNLTEAFENLFAKHILVYNGVDVKTVINDCNEKMFHEELIFLFKMMLQMRNSFTNSEVDYLISPVINQKGEYYSSEFANETLPKNADANGAFNIARKGLWVIDKIKNTDDIKKVKLGITNKEWLAFAQGIK